MKTQYGREAGASCDICLSKLAGLGGHSCSACNIDLHDACAGYFKETTSFFAHPRHTLKLSRIPHPSASSPVRWSCDLCLEECRPGSFVYRCIQCLFDVHPLCTMLPQMIRSPLHPSARPTPSDLTPVTSTPPTDSTIVVSEPAAPSASPTSAAPTTPLEQKSSSADDD